MLPFKLISVLNGTELKVILYLTNCKGYAKVKQDDLAFAIGCTPRAVRDALKSLENMELIKYTRKPLSKQLSELSIDNEAIEYFCANT